MILPDDEEELESRIDELAHNTDAWHYEFFKAYFESLRLKYPSYVFLITISC